MGIDQKRIYLSSPHMSGRELEYVKKAFESNWVAPLGPNIDAFEKCLADYCDVHSAAALISGTAAIHLALILLGVGVKDKVLTSTFTFSATVNPIIYQGATPLFIDSEPGTWNMDPVLLEKAILSDRKRKEDGSIKAIIVVHLYGMPARIDEIIAIADKYGIPVIEDAAEALGSKYNGKPLGSFGTVGVLSFNGNKIITTSGGGALISNDNHLIERARFLASQARDEAPHYQHSQIGYNYRMSNVLAGIGLGQIEVIDDRVKKRRENYQFYRDHLKDWDGIELLDEPDPLFYSNRWLTTILLDPDKLEITNKILQQRFEEENIELRPLWKPMHQQPVFKTYPSWLNGTSDKLFEIGICLPSGSNMSNADRERVLDSLTRYL